MEDQKEKSRFETVPVASVEKAKGRRGRYSHRARYAALLILVMVCTLSGFLGGWLYSRGAKPSTQTQRIVLQSQGQLISSIAQSVGQSVVSVEVTSTPNINSDNFFGTSAQGTAQNSAGTGIILTSGGLIMTNRHVVPVGTQTVSVILSDGTSYSNVKVVGRTTDVDSLDVAFLQIQDTKGKKLTPAQIGDSGKVAIGDSVIAIGNALGQFQNTVTSGIISGHGRNIQAGSNDGSNSRENLEDLFQTDAAINEGNSGGPLVNLEGKVIGMNTAIASNSQNIGFAIPIDNLKGLISSVEKTGKLERPYLGVVFIPLTSDLATQYGLNASSGAYIPPASTIGQQTIVSDGPAARAGIHEGDIITSINGTAIDRNTNLTTILDSHSVGDRVTLNINRNGKNISISVELGAAPTN